MAVVFLFIAGLPLWAGKPWRVWALVAAAILATIAVLAPALLSPLNRLWMAFGEGLRRIMSPVILAFIFFCVLTPLGLLMRLIGKDLLRLRFEPGADSYWIRRDPPGPEPESFTDQF